MPPPTLNPQRFQILLALADGDRHGLEVMREVLERTEGRMRLWPAMLYGSLKKLGEDGLVEETDGPPEVVVGGGRPRFYRLTAAGRRALADEVARLERYVEVARARRVGPPVEVR